MAVFQFSLKYYKKHLKNVGPIRHASRRTPIQRVSLPVLSCAACASMSTTTTTTTTTTTRDKGDRYGPMEWAQKLYYTLFSFKYTQIKQIEQHRPYTICNFEA